MKLEKTDAKALDAKSDTKPPAPKPKSTAVKLLQGKAPKVEKTIPNCSWCGTPFHMAVRKSGDPSWCRCENCKKRFKYENGVVEGYENAWESTEAVKQMREAAANQPPKPILEIGPHEFKTGRGKPPRDPQDRKCVLCNNTLRNHGG